MPEPTEVRDGIEWYELGEGRGSDAQCARCGSSVEFLTCWNCDDGFVPDYGPEGWDEGDEKPCDVCKGTGGSWHCLSSPEHCNANPIAGREHIQSTALRSEAWND